MDKFAGISLVFLGKSSKVLLLIEKKECSCFPFYYILNLKNGTNQESYFFRDLKKKTKK